MPLEVVRIPVLKDNYVWLVHESQSSMTTVVDPAVAAPVLAEADKRGWRITDIWNTHWHPDHIGGNAEIKAATGCTITGPAGEVERIRTIDRPVSGGDIVSLGVLDARVIDLPAHTAGHIAYHFADEQAVFVGDTLFAMGCGRLFEGTADQMFANMAKLSALPNETLVYCAHEYTQSNGRFALATEPENEDVRARMTQVDAARARGEATVPTTIGMERGTNPFMRASSVAEFAQRRMAKDNFS